MHVDINDGTDTSKRSWPHGETHRLSSPMLLLKFSGRSLTSANMACGFSPVQHCFVADCRHWLVLLFSVDLRQAVEECSCLRFQSEQVQTPQDSRDPQMIVISRRKPDCRLGREIRSASNRDLLA